MSQGTLVYDDDCGFCTWWADLLADRSDLAVVGFSEVGPALRERLPTDYEECSHLVADGRVYSCGASVEEAVARAVPGAGVRPLVGFLREFEDYERLRERTYRWVADHRGLLGRVISKPPPARGGSDPGG